MTTGCVVEGVHDPEVAMRHHSHATANASVPNDAERLGTSQPVCGCQVHSTIYASGSDGLCVTSIHISLEGEWSDANTTALLPLLDVAVRLPSALVVVDVSAVRSSG